MNRGAKAQVPSKARNSDNQPVLEYLTTLSQKERFNNPSSHYPLIFQRALKSIATTETYINSFEEAKKLTHVGGFLASQIAKFYESQQQQQQQQQDLQLQPDGEQERHDHRQSKRQRGASEAGNGNPKSSDVLLPRSLSMNSHSSNSSNNVVAIPSATQAADLVKKSSLVAKTLTTSNITPADLSYQRASEFSDYLSRPINGSRTTMLQQQYSNFTVVLLIDTREQKSDLVQSKLLQLGISCEQRQLPIGDMLWIARGFKRDTTSASATTSTALPSGFSTSASLPDTVEIVLDTIIERKTLDDLISSLYGTRWNEQRLRLKQHSTLSGSTTAFRSVISASSQQPQVIYLIESTSTVQQDARRPVHTHNNSFSSSTAPSSSTASNPSSSQQQTIQSCVFNTMIQLGFGIIRTRNLDDTIQWLRRIHVRLIKRYFGSDCEKHSKSSDSSFSYPPKTTNSSATYRLYEEYKANIELARERGTKSVSSIFAAQLKQIQGMSMKRVSAITTLYPTPKSLFDAYASCTAAGGDVAKMVEDASMCAVEGSNLHRQRTGRIGPKCSLELSRVFLQGGKGESAVMPRPADVGTSLRNISNSVTHSGSMSAATSVASDSGIMSNVPVNAIRSGLISEPAAITVESSSSNKLMDRCLQAAKSFDDDFADSSPIKTYSP